MMNSQTANSNDGPIAGAPGSYDRKQSEIAFHNQRERDRQVLTTGAWLRKYSNKKWYSIDRTSRSYVEAWLDRHAAAGTALDYCCGLGEMSLAMARRGSTVYAVDISDESVRTTAAKAAANSLTSRVRTSVMDAEQLAFPDSTFDVIVCSGVLHHLELTSAYRELARVLKPTGRILCMEALAHNPIIQLYRRRTPHLRTAWETEHILRISDLRRARTHFARLDLRFFHLASIAATPFRDTRAFHSILSILEHVDNLILRVPGLRLMAWQVVFDMSQPKK